MRGHCPWAVAGLIERLFRPARPRGATTCSCGCRLRRAGLDVVGLLPRLEDHAQRAGQQGGEVDQLGDGAQPEDDQHQDAEPLRGRERADGKDREPQAADDGGLQRGRGAVLVGGEDRLLAVAQPVELLAEPVEIVDRVIDGDAQGDAGGHHRADIDVDPQPAHAAEDHQDRQHVGQHRDRCRR